MMGKALTVLRFGNEHHSRNGVFPTCTTLVKWQRCIQRSENHPSSINMPVVSKIFLISTPT